MAAILSMDLSKRSTGWALWDDTMPKPVSGLWSLGSELTPAGRSFLRLHQAMNDLWQVTPFDIVVYEEPLNLGPHAGFTNRDTIFVLTGLAAHVDSFCEARAIRKVRSVNNVSWRRHFLGPMKRGTKRVRLKELAMERCRQLGLSPAKDDEADALGVLDYMCDLEGIMPPWRKNEVLRPPLGRVS